MDVRLARQTFERAPFVTHQSARLLAGVYGIDHQ
jgi:hypothetical protein